MTVNHESEDTVTTRQNHEPSADELVPTSTADWPKNVAQTVTLPSGGVACIKRPDAFNLVRVGKVPKKVSTVMVKQNAAKPITEAEAITLLEFLIAASFVEPEVTFTRKAGVLCISDIGDEDKGAVIGLLRLV